MKKEIKTVVLKNEELTQVQGGNTLGRRPIIDLPQCYSDPHYEPCMDCKSCEFYERCTNRNKQR